jgi:rSAM/selenodomain-associated transferase 1
VSHTGTSADTGIVLFARTPLAGATKTRLIPLLGEEGAAELHRDMMLACIQQASAVIDHPVELWCMPDSAHPFFAECRQQHGVMTYVQQGRDLGEAMAHAFRSTLQRYERVLLAGTDCPQLTAAVFRAVMRALERNTAVVVPSTDGGYVLLGLSAFDVSLFEDIDWGSDRVLQQTRDRLAAMGWSWQELPALIDIDTPEDYLGFYGQGRVVAPV